VIQIPIGFTPVKQFVMNKFDKRASSALNSIVTQSTVLASLAVGVLWDLNIDYIGSLMMRSLPLILMNPLTALECSHIDGFMLVLV